MVIVVGFPIYLLFVFISLLILLGVLELHLYESSPIITPIVMLSNINRALGILTAQNHSLISTISVFCKAKITNRSESKIIIIIINLIIEFFSKVRIFNKNHAWTRKAMCLSYNVWL